MSSSPLTSPCIKVCAVDGRTGWCLGCGRTLSEIGSWGAMDAAGRDEVTKNLPGRMAKLRAMGKLGAS